MNCIFQFRLAFLDLHLLCFFNDFPLVIYFLHGYLFQIIQHDHISLTSRRNSPQMLQSVAHSRTNRCHLNSLNRIHAKQNRFTHIMVNMAFTFNIFNMLIICAEAKTLSVHFILYNACNNCFQIPGSTSFPDQYMHSPSPFFHCVFKIRTLMICGNACHHICLQILI